jgi:hypothetical protein
LRRNSGRGRRGFGPTTETLKLPRYRGAFGGLGNYGSVVTASMASS